MNMKKGSALHNAQQRVETASKMLSNAVDKIIAERNHLLYELREVKAANMKLRMDLQASNDVAQQYLSELTDIKTTIKLHEDQ